MKTFIYILLLCFFLTACGGPKTIGEGEARAEISGLGYVNDDPGHLRYPISGRKIDQKLYYLNQPHNIQAWQEQQKNFMRNIMARDGVVPNDYNNLKPRQASPFRQ